MKAPAWFGDDAGARPHPVAASALGAVSRIYQAVGALRRAAHRTGLLRAHRVECAVVSVGSVVVGGSGKTPAAAWLARALRSRGHRVALATRGYARSGREPVHVLSDGEAIVGDPLSVGDEAMLLAGHAPGVPVLVGPDRARVGRSAVARFGIDVLVLDDGFQHLRLHRDFELLTLDGGFGFGNSHVLPRGPLREGLSALRAADALLLVDGALSSADRTRLRDSIPPARCYSAFRRAASLRRLGGEGVESPASLAGRRVGALAGIALPDEFERTITDLGAEVVARRHFADHHVYRARDLLGLAAEASIWLTTEKDASRLPPSLVSDLDVRVLTIELEVEADDVLLGSIEARLASR